MDSDYTSCLCLVKIHRAVHFNIIFYLNMFLKCLLYTRPCFLNPGKNRDIHVDFLLQIIFYPKQEQDSIKCLQVSSSNLPGTDTSAKGTGKGPGLGKDGKNNQIAVEFKTCRYLGGGGRYVFVTFSLSLRK